MENRKIKVLRIINRFNIGGPTYNATFLTRYLPEEYETLLIGGLPEEGEADSLHILEEYGVKPLLIKELQRKPNLKSDWAAYKKIKAIIEDFKPDIVHTHAAKAGAIGRRAAFKCNVPVIIHTFHGHVFHSYFGKLKTEVFRFIEQRLAVKSSKIIAISELQKNDLSTVFKICKEPKIRVIPLGFDLMKFNEQAAQNRILTRKKYGIQDDEIALAIIGRLAPIKDHQFFFDVLQEVQKKTSKKLKVFVVGDGEEMLNVVKITNQFVKNERFNIDLTSWIKEVSSFSPGMDVICLCSKNEGTPVSLIEAQASNVAVISTDVGGVRDVVQENETGFIVTQGAINEYTEKLMKLIEDDNLRKRMSEKGWPFVKERFHYETLVKNMDQLYKELLDEKKVKIV